MSVLLAVMLTAVSADLFIGTEGDGHVTPAACVPFGLVQAGPDTGVGHWKYCSGYQFSDRTIIGFSQTHLSGTGCPDLGDVSIMPFVGDYDESHADRMEEGSEKAEPGFYCVKLQRSGATVEVTTTKRVAVYRITYPSSIRVGRLLVNLPFALHYPQNKSWARCKWESCASRMEDPRTLTGQYVRKVWCTRQVGFVVKTSRAAVCVRELKAVEGVCPSRYLLDFDVSDGQSLEVRVALSSSDELSALRNYSVEVSGLSFDEIRCRAKSAWDEVFSTVTVTGGDHARIRQFYTALYHLCVQPNDISDADSGSAFYSTFSTWDTFRAAHPAYTIIMPERAAELVESLVEQGRRTGYMPIWPLWGSETQCMIGTHSVPIIVDAYLKGLWPRGNAGAGVVEECYQLIKNTLTTRHRDREKEDWDVYDRYGYYPFDLISGESVSRTLECAYDDWCAAQLADRLGHDEDKKFFEGRASRWRNVFDARTKLVRGRDTQGRWREPFDPLSYGRGAGTGNDFTEGNSWQYTWHVMHDVPGLIDAMGGCQSLVDRLLMLFDDGRPVGGLDPPHDVSGLIGQYAHGNEPSHHVAYLFTLAGRQDLTAYYVRQIFDSQYQVAPGGLCGNDDCGQMSAWYIFSAIGFYPVNPCGGEYVIGAPQVPRVEMKVGGQGQQRTFKVFAKGLSKENKYVKSVTLNGKPITDWKIRHEDIMKGGELVFEMCDK